MNTIAIYNENCVMAGRAVPLKRLDESPDSDDWTHYELSEESAADIEQRRGRFGRLVASTIRAAL
jgi:hypothetical protein